MRNLFINKIRKNEDGAVLITSLLFLMVVTVLSVIGMQSPKTDIMISGNEKITAQAQELANMGVMEAKNWLSVHYKPNAIPLNAGMGDKLFIVARPDSVIDQKFSRAGILTQGTVAIDFESDSGDISDSNFNAPEGYNGGLGKTLSASDYTLKDSANGTTIASYEWNIVRISQVGTILDPTVKEAKEDSINTFMSGKGAINGKFSNPIPITEGYNAAIGEDKAFWQYFYISSSADSDGLIAEAEGIASYKQIVPSTD